MVAQQAKIEIVRYSVIILFIPSQLELALSYRTYALELTRFNKVLASKTQASFLESMFGLCLAGKKDRRPERNRGKSTEPKNTI